MIARDLGCSFPGCTAPPAWCQAHHITDFSLTRRTSVDDGTLLCGFHSDDVLVQSGPGLTLDFIDA